MASSNTLLCIHRDPAQLRSLQKNGYKLVNATNGHDGLRLLASQSVDAIVLDYQLVILDGIFVANEIKRAHPTIPIVMLADDLELPNGALSSVDALVTKSDGAHFLWATVHFVLNVKPTQRSERKLSTQMPEYPRRRAGRSAGQAHHFHTGASLDPKDAPFSPKEWRSIQMGIVRF